MTRLPEVEALPMLVVDVQPLYHEHCQFVTRRLVDLLNAGQPRRMVWYYVAAETGIGGDTEADVRQYLEDHGLSPDVLDSTQFVPKDYGFLRGWMDTGVDDDAIVGALRLMRELGLHDSRDLTGHEVLAADAHEAVREAVEAGHGDAIFEPSFDVRPLLAQRRWKTAGGGQTECLKELELYAQSHDIVFDIDDYGLVYG